MKKFLRFLMILLGVVVVIIIVLGLIAPNDVTVTRSTVINAPKEMVNEQVLNFRNWINWSPWYKKDSAMKITYSGEDGKVGGTYHWLGSKDKDLGEGEMKMLAIKDGEADLSIKMIHPWEQTSDIVFMMTDTGDATKITWTMKMHFSFPWNAGCIFMNMDKMLGSDFENGLKDMKAYIETNTSKMPKVEIKEMQFPAHMYAGVRSTVAWSELSKVFMDAYPMLGKAAGPRIVGPGSGLYYTWDTVKHNTDMMACFPVADTSKPVKGATFAYVPASMAYIAVHHGGYASSMTEHTALMKHVKKNGKTVSLVIEEYLVGPGSEPDSNKYVTNIYYLTK